MGEEMTKCETLPLLETPWRTLEWGENERELQYVKDYLPHTEDQQLRILLCGVTGAGTSSFINTVQSVLHGRMYIQALAEGICHRSFTKKYTTYKFQKEGCGSFYPFVFNDTMGLAHNNGVLVDDIKLALKGHMRNGYKFNPQSKLSCMDERFYNKYPTVNDRVHVLVYVFEWRSVVSEEILKKIRDIRMEASQLHIPQVAIITKIDMFTNEINENLQNVYKDQYLMKMMKEISATVDIPINCIFPVKNYHSEINTNSDVDALILNTLSNIINFGDGCINF